MVRGFMVAGTASGVGKTTVTMGLIGALARRGLKVQPFKAGPDYIDPTYHTRAAGVPCRNLDTWLIPHAGVVELFTRAMRGRDAAVVEGVMGLFDGRSGSGEEGSGAELAKLLGLPVVLVVDASAVARSIAATVLGFQTFDPAVRLVGVILNGVGSPRHAAICGEAIQETTGLPVLGAVPRSDDVRLPERHLGLIPVAEGATADEVFDRITDVVEQAVDLSALLDLAQGTPPRPGGAALFPDRPVPAQARIAVAKDRAFSFYYQDSLDLLEAWGAEMSLFSPLEDSALPDGVTGVYIGGGFPELYARDLAANEAMMQALRQAAERRIPIYGECGGLMYLGQSMAAFDEDAHSMVGLIPAASRLADKRLTLGYRTVRALSDGPLLRRGQQVRGHEFHWSVLEEDGVLGNPAYEITEGQGRREGFQVGSVLASYVHLHLASDPALAPRFVNACRRAREALE